MTFKNRPRPFHNRPSLHNSLPNTIRDQGDLMFRAANGGVNHNVGLHSGGHPVAGRVSDFSSGRFHHQPHSNGSEACFSMTITQLQAPGPKPISKPRTAPVVNYPKLKRRPTTRQLPAKPKVGKWAGLSFLPPN